MRGEHAAKILELEDKIDKFQKEIETTKKLVESLESQLNDLKVPIISFCDFNILNFTFFNKERGRF